MPRPGCPSSLPASTSCVSARRPTAHRRDRRRARRSHRPGPTGDDARSGRMALGDLQPSRGPLGRSAHRLVRRAAAGRAAIASKPASPSSSRAASLRRGARRARSATTT
jgi:hypothetical protein